MSEQQQTQPGVEGQQTPPASDVRDQRIADLERQLEAERADRPRDDYRDPVDNGDDGYAPEPASSYDPGQLVEVVDADRVDDEDAPVTGYGHVVASRDVEGEGEDEDTAELTVALLGGGTTIVRPEQVRPVGQSG